MKRILSLTRKCIQDYDMISQGDKIAVGVSGGKDSLVLLKALAELRSFYPIPFSLVAITVDPGIPGMSFDGISEFCKGLDVEYIIVESQLYDIIFNIRKESNPCSLCAKMRRGMLHDAAIAAGCNKIALGHHFDDAVETFMLSQVYEGRLSCFLPVTWLDRKQITMIRPLLYITESMAKGAVNRLALPVVENPCPADGNTKRQEIKDLLKDLNKRYPGIRERIFGAMQRLPLPGWQMKE